MDTQRLVLLLLFSFSLYFLMEGYHRETRPPATPTAPHPTPAASSTAVPTPTATAVPEDRKPVSAAAPATKSGEIVRITTDSLIAEIDSTGGDLRYVELRQHRDTLDPKKNLVLLQNSGDHVYVAQSGLLGGDLPSHRTVFSVQEHDDKAIGSDPARVRLTATTASGAEITKTYTFRNGSYVIDVAFEVNNRSHSPLDVDAYFQLVRDSTPPAGDSSMVPTFTGYAAYTENEKFQKAPFADVDKGKTNFPKKSNDGWIALVQHYFLTAWLPAGNVAREFYLRKLDNGLYSGGIILPVGHIEPGQGASIEVPLYTGPQEQNKLHALAPGLELTVDYGWLTIIAVPLFEALQWLHKWVSNWGVAIIIVTVILKALFFPLSAASYRSMARMRVLAPRLQKLKEQYGEDRQRMNQAMMELYRTEKINPLGGCLPVVVQIPVFISLYWVLLASVELRNAPFFGWITDLSKADPYFVLPVLMGATMILQTAMSPAPPDPVQAKVMKIMPIAFSVMFFFFPAGLVLYWLVNNILSIAQQWSITRALEHAKPGHGK